MMVALCNYYHLSMTQLIFVSLKEQEIELVMVEIDDDVTTYDCV